jgi:hypothetical protein
VQLDQRLSDARARGEALRESGAISLAGPAQQAGF